MKRSRSIRACVVRLVVAVTLPLLVFGAFLLIRSAQTEQRTIATTAEERAEGAAADLDRELRNLQDLASVLATSRFLFATDLEDPHAVSLGLVADRTLGLAVRDLSGRALFNSCNADSRPIPLDSALDDILNTVGGKARISDLMVEATNGEPVLTMDLPVWRANYTPYILSLCALPRIFQILTEQHLPDGWTATVSDREGRIIATTPGTASAPSAVGDGDAATFPMAWGTLMHWLWGKSTLGYRASSPVELAKWTVTVEVPNETFFGPVRRSFFGLLVAGLGTAALVMVLAVYSGRRIAGPITDRTGIATALRNGGGAAPRLTGIREADTVSQALFSTSEDLSRHTAELTESAEALRERETRLERLSDELRKALDERTELLNRTVSAQEDERQRVARELHAYRPLSRPRGCRRGSIHHPTWSSTVVTPPQAISVSSQRF